MGILEDATRTFLEGFVEGLRGSNQEIWYNRGFEDGKNGNPRRQYFTYPDMAPFYNEGYDDALATTTTRLLHAATEKIKK